MKAFVQQVEQDILGLEAILPPCSSGSPHLLLSSQGRHHNTTVA